jgi:hypothetical protein
MDQHLGRNRTRIHDPVKGHIQLPRDELHLYAVPRLQRPGERGPPEDVYAVGHSSHKEAVIHEEGAVRIEAVEAGHGVGIHDRPPGGGLEDPVTVAGAQYEEISAMHGQGAGRDAETEGIDSPHRPVSSQVD